MYSTRDRVVCKKSGFSSNFMNYGPVWKHIITHCYKCWNNWSHENSSSPENNSLNAKMMLVIKKHCFH